MALSTKDVVLIALFTALMAAFGLLPKINLIPFVPITAQSMVVMLAGGILGAKRGALSMALFVLLVAVGLPLLSGGRGGFGMFATPSGGYLIGFILGAFVTGLIVEKYWAKLDHYFALLASLIGGVLVVTVCGIVYWWLLWVNSAPEKYQALGSGELLQTVMVLASGFIPGDIVKAILAAIVIVFVKKSYPLIAK